MKKQVRKGVFETNSSSTHAMAIQNYPCVMYGIYEKLSDEKIDEFNNCDDVKDGYCCKIIKKEDLPAIVTFHEGEFGWQIRTIKADDYDGKASYLYTAMADLLTFDEFDDTVKRIEKWLNEEGIGAEFQPYKKRDKEYITMYDFRSCDVELVRENEYDRGYLDHYHEANSFMCYVIAKKSNFFNYLFGDSFIKMGNDNQECDIELYDKDSDTGWTFKITHTTFYKGN